MFCWRHSDRTPAHSVIANRTFSDAEFIFTAFSRTGTGCNSNSVYRFSCGREFLWKYSSCQAIKQIYTYTSSYSYERTIMSENLQQSLVLIKPDALKNSLTGYVLSYLSEYHTGLQFAGSKIVSVSDMLAGEHYAEHKGKPFFPSLLKYIKGEIHYADNPKGRRTIAIVYHGMDAVQKIRNIAGPTNPLVARDTKPGCIRALGTLAPIKDVQGAVIGERMDNLIHASANTADAAREIKLWFKPEDIPPAMREYPASTCETHYYYLKGALLQEHVEGSFCILAPGNVAWKSDLEALELISEGKESAVTLETVAAKYLINS